MTSSESKASKGIEESPHWTTYTTSNIKLMKPYNGDFELVKVPCLKKTDILIIRNDGYMAFIAKSAIPLIDRQFMGNLDPFAVVEMLQADTMKVYLFLILTVISTYIFTAQLLIIITLYFTDCRHHFLHHRHNI